MYVTFKYIVLVRPCEDGSVVVGLVGKAGESRRASVLGGGRARGVR